MSDCFKKIAGCFLVAAALLSAEAKNAIERELAEADVEIAAKKAKLAAAEAYKESLEQELPKLKLSPPLKKPKPMKP